MVVAAGVDSELLPPITPPLQVIALPVRLIVAVPLSVPPCIDSVGMESALPLLRVSVPPTTVRSPMLVMLFSVVAAPLAFVTPVMLYGALTVFVPPCHCTVPAPLIDDAASNVRVSFE